MLEKDEMFSNTEPTAEKCLTCKYALDDVKVMGKVVSRRRFGKCLKYEYKPIEVLNNGADCEEYCDERI